MSSSSESSSAFDLADSTWVETAALPAGEWIALLPIGSTEAHGPHLPLSTDVIIAQGMARRAAELLAQRGRAARCLPALPYTVTDCAAEFAGTISVPASAVEALLVEICAAVVRQGARTICLCNAHLEPAHRKMLQRVVERSREAGRDVIFPDYVRRPFVARLGSEFQSGACHAGQYESALVLALAPERVHESILRSLPDVPISLGEALAAGKETFKTIGGDQAYFGYPARATAEDGRRWLEELAKIVVECVESAR